MTRFLKTIGLFFAFAAVVYTVLVFIFGSFLPRALKPDMFYQKGAPGQLYTRLEQADTVQGPLDILFLGSSHSYRGFDPRLFEGYKTFNLGSSSQSPLQTQVLLSRYLTRFKPKVIIYEVYPYTLCIDGVESAVDLIANGQGNDLGSLEMSLKMNEIKVYNTLLYGITRDWLSLNKSFKEPLVKMDDRYISGGYVEKELKYFKHVVYPEKKEWVLNPKQVKAFEENLEMIKQRKIKLVLVYAPITSSLYKSYTNNDYIDSVMKQYSNGNYYNFNEMLNLDDSLDFFNSHHLNQRGVEQFDREVKERVLNH